jgi:NTE family protein
MTAAGRLPQPVAVTDLQHRWQLALPRPRAFVLSGGASLGGVQVGMLQALGAHGLDPDVVVGTSVGAMHAAVLAETASSAAAAERLGPIWHTLRRRDVFTGSLLTQARRVVREGVLHDPAGLRRLIRRTLRADRFDELRLPLTVVATEVLTGHVRRLIDGPLVPALLASSALPGVFPTVSIDGCPLWDGGSVANVPLRSALAAGAASVVVLDAGDICHLDAPPRGIPEGIVMSITTAMRQRVHLEAPLIANKVPVAYLPRPCAQNWSLLDLDRGHELIAPAREQAGRFLFEEDPPTLGRMAGAPHHHGDRTEAVTLP